MYNDQKHQWIFRLSSVAALATEVVSLLRQVRETWLGISVPSETQLAVFLIVDILLMAYVFHRASKARESYIRAAVAREMLWMPETGISCGSWRDEVESELRVTIECYRSAIRAIDQSVIVSFIDPGELVERRRELQNCVDTLEGARLTLSGVKPDHLLRARLELWDTVDKIGRTDQALLDSLGTNQVSRSRFEGMNRFSNGRRSAHGPSMGS